VRAGLLGLQLMVAIIGGKTHRFRPLVDLYRQAGKRAGYSAELLKAGVYSLGYVAESTQEAVDDLSRLCIYHDGDWEGAGMAKGDTSQF